MNKVKLIEYAKMISKNVQIAYDIAKECNALVIENYQILVDLDMVNTSLENETIEILKDINKICVQE